MYSYVLIEEQKLCEGVPYSVFGIRSEDGISISDISSDREFVQGIIAKLHEWHIPSYQMMDIVEDELAER